MMAILVDFLLFTVSYALLGPFWGKVSLFIGVTLAVIIPISIAYNKGELSEREAMIMGLVIWLVLIYLSYRLTLWMDTEWASNRH